MGRITVRNLRGQLNMSYEDSERESEKLENMWTVFKKLVFTVNAKSYGSKRRGIEVMAGMSIVE